MGQYHRIYNLDKKETFSTHRMGDGAKLLEWGMGGCYSAAIAVLLCNSNGRGGGDLNVHGEYDRKTMKCSYTAQQRLALANVARMAGRWAGDRIVVQGDYAEQGDKAFITEEAMEGFTDITQICVNGLAADGYIRSQLLEAYGVDKENVPDYSDKPVVKAKRTRKKSK